MSKSARTKSQKTQSSQNKNRPGNQPRKGTQARNRQQRNVLTQRQVPWGGIVFFTVIGVVAAIAIGYAFMQSRSSSDGDGNASISGVVQKDGLSRNHTTAAVKYDTNPPMGGDHNPVWQNCDGRVYDQPLKNENAVHSLEHGAVWITYKTGLATDQLDRLKEKVTATDYTMLSPDPSQDSPVTLTAWGKQLKVQNATDSRVDAFLRAYVKGPQTPEPGAACSGGKDTP